GPPVLPSFPTRRSSDHVQDNIFGDDVVWWLRRLDARPRHLVVLRTAVEVIARREAARTQSRDKVAYRPGEVTIEDLDEAVGSTRSEEHTSELRSPYELV